MLAGKWNADVSADANRSGGERPGDEHSDLFIVATIYLFVLVATIVVLVFQQASWAAGLDHGD